MAILDRRLIPFVEMLTDFGLDWLAFELIDGIRRGREPEETTEALTVAREQVRADEVKNVKRELAESVEAGSPLGDGQLDWAARYVDERLEATLAEMSASLDNIDGIVGPTHHEGAAGSRPAAAALVLLNREERWKVDRAMVEDARGQLPKSREALASWLASTRTGLAQ
jgi:hypothetical protein